MALESISENVKGKNFLSCQGRGEEEGRRGGGKEGRRGGGEEGRKGGGEDGRKQQPGSIVRE